MSTSRVLCLQHGTNLTTILLTSFSNEPLQGTVSPTLLSGRQNGGLDSQVAPQVLPRSLRLGWTLSTLQWPQAKSPTSHSRPSPPVQTQYTQAAGILEDPIYAPRRTDADSRMTYGTPPLGYWELDLTMAQYLVPIPCTSSSGLKISVQPIL